MRRRRWIIWIVVALLAWAAGAILLARVTLRLGPPHRRTAPAADLGETARLRLERALEQRPGGTVDDAVALALNYSGGLLRFGLGHATTLRFEGHRSGNCVEYAHLFGSAFNAAARRWGLAATATVVRSYDARVFGFRLPFPGWRDHDWVLIEGARPDERRFIDPSFWDALLGADVRRNVRGLPESR